MIDKNDLDDGEEKDSGQHRPRLKTNVSNLKCQACMKPNPEGKRYAGS